MVKRNFDREVRFRITREMEQQIKAAALAKGKSVPEYLRQALKEYFVTNELADMTSYIQSAVASAVEEKLKPVENRLAKITAKTAMASAISTYFMAYAMNYILVKWDIKTKSIVELFGEARKKAIAFVQSGIPHTGQLENFMVNAGAEAEIAAENDKAANSE